MAGCCAIAVSPEHNWFEILAVNVRRLRFCRNLMKQANNNEEIVILQALGLSN